MVYHRSQQHRIRTRVLLVESPKLYPLAIALYSCELTIVSHILSGVSICGIYRKQF